MKRIFMMVIAVFSVCPFDMYGTRVHPSAIIIGKEVYPLDKYGTLNPRYFPNNPQSIQSLRAPYYFLPSSSPQEACTRKPFTAVENALLHRLVERYGTNDWQRVADEMPGRSRTQCAVQWTRSNSQSSHSDFSLKDDILIMIFAIRSSLKRWKRFQRDFFPDKLDSNLRHRYNLIMRRVNEMRGGNNQFTWQDAVLGMRRSGEAASQETPTKEAFQALLDRAEIEYNQWAQPGPVELLQEAFQVVPEEVRVVPPKLRMTLGYRTNP